MIWYAKNITYDEMIFSQIAERNCIDNTPKSDEIIDNLSKAALALQVIRSFYDKPLIINSGYRCEELNRIVDGSENSHHMTGSAVDFTVPGYSVSQVIEDAKDLIFFDQLINAYDKWVHLSISYFMRGQVLEIKH